MEMKGTVHAAPKHSGEIVWTVYIIAAVENSVDPKCFKSFSRRKV
jgi:hypothetical protein